MAFVTAVGIMALVSQDGESNWMEGVQLLPVYLIRAHVPFPAGVIAGYGLGTHRQRRPVTHRPPPDTGRRPACRPKS